MSNQTSQGNGSSRSVAKVTTQETGPDGQVRTKTVTTTTTKSLDEDGNWVESTSTKTSYGNGIADDDEMATSGKGGPSRTLGAAQKVVVSGKGNGKHLVAAVSLSPEEYQKQCLEAHNVMRAKHGCPPLMLDQKLFDHAKEWVEHLAKEDKFEHRPQAKSGPNYGENIYMQWSSDPKFNITPSGPVDNWYSEIKDYKTFGKEPNLSSFVSGHFTQLIWKTSTHVGIASARSKSNKVLVVANYNPPGNMMGKFAECVPPVKK